MKKKPRYFLDSHFEEIKRFLGKDKHPFAPDLIEELRARHVDFRKLYPKEIDRVSSALVQGKALAGVDSTRYLHPPDVSSALVRTKLAESIVEAFDGRRLIANVSDQAVNDSVLYQSHATAYNRAARTLKRVDPVLAEHCRQKAEYCHFASKRLEGFLSSPANTWNAQLLNIFTFDLAAILVHTTDLNPSHLFKKVVPKIIRVAFACYPDIAPATGAGSPYARYKRTGTPWERANHLLFSRYLLFLGDDRFSKKLFLPHPNHRSDQDS